ncbi:MAG: phage terminase large subunit family protein, partial [Desulfofustis sp.]|nr:phage terminase large subunit family protein [Desulfofustis sp.]
VDVEDVIADRKEDAILALCDDRFSGVVNLLTDILTITIDTQDKGFWYEIRGWQYGLALSSWLVKAGYIPSARFDDFSGLDKLIFDDKYFDQNGKEYQISYGMIDSGGHRTAEVYAWCKKTGIFAAKGAKGRKAQPVTVSIQEHFPGTNKAIPGGLRLYNLDTHYHKDILADKLTLDPSDAGAWVLHSGYSKIQYDMMEKDSNLKLPNRLLTYAKHFTVEYRDEKKLWQCPDGKRNDLWDCSQMGIALAYYLKFNEMVSEHDQKTKNEQQVIPHENSPSQPDSGSRPSWFHKRGR